MGDSVFLYMCHILYSNLTMVPYFLKCIVHVYSYDTIRTRLLHTYIVHTCVHMYHMCTTYYMYSYIYYVVYMYTLNLHLLSFCPHRNNELENKFIHTCKIENSCVLRRHREICILIIYQTIITVYCLIKNKNIFEYKI